jgi:hypothetical protein
MVSLVKIFTLSQKCIELLRRSLMNKLYQRVQRGYFSYIVIQKIRSRDPSRNSRRVLMTQNHLHALCFCLRGAACILRYTAYNCLRRARAA